MPVAQFIAGVIAALGAGALWGLSYVLPMMIPDYTAMEIILGRYLVYGILSLALLARSFSLIPRERAIWRAAFLFAVTGNVLYYLLEVIGIRLLMPSIVAMFFCFLPVMVTCYGNLRHKEYPWRYVLFTICLILSGLLMTQIGGTVTFEWDADRYLGLVVTLLALIMWSYYAVHNASFLKSSQVSVGQLTSMIGLCCLAITMAVLAVDAASALYAHHFWQSVGFYFNSYYLFVCGVLGVFVTWLGTVCWNYASQTLPITIAGQLITGEIVFGLLYSYLYESRMPGALELGGLCLAIGAITCFLSFKHRFKLKR